MKEWPPISHATEGKSYVFPVTIALSALAAD